MESGPPLAVSDVQAPSNAATSTAATPAAIDRRLSLPARSATARPYRRSSAGGLISFLRRPVSQDSFCERAGERDARFVALVRELAQSSKCPVMHRTEVSTDRQLCQVTWTAVWRAGFASCRIIVDLIRRRDSAQNWLENSQVRSQMNGSAGAPGEGSPTSVRCS